MVVNETNNKYLFEEEQLIETLKKILNKLKSIPKLFKSNTSQNIIDENCEINEPNIYKQNVENLLNTMNNIANILSEDPLFKEEEFYDFMDIKRITKYILTKKEENINLVYNLINKFIEIYELKINYIEKYDNQYKQFKKFLLESEEKFYTKIYVPTNKYKKTIDIIYDNMKQDFIKE
jgi:hypothetical protein